GGNLNLSHRPPKESSEDNLLMRPPRKPALRAVSHFQETTTMTEKLDRPICWNVFPAIVYCFIYSGVTPERQHCGWELASPGSWMRVAVYPQRRTGSGRL